MSMDQLAVKERRLLAEFPAFFLSLEKIRMELRVRESHMTIILNYDARTYRTGRRPGVSDPAALFTAGESGWDARVKDPAGLGFFALLGMALPLKASLYLWHASKGFLITGGAGRHHPRNHRFYENQAP